KTPHEKAMQRALIQYRNPNNYHLVQEALHIAGRDDLIGFDKKCLIRPRTGHKALNSHVAVKTEQKTGSKTGQKKKTIRNVHKKKK
ncbi:MAG: DUF3362 domain-containing protein, partial [Vallitaleaceae bacterium]|nr:DUF3362 domain-containing protein [Vallitaleaceae bacterium]